MLELRDGSTVGEVWTDAVRTHGDRPFIAFPAGAHPGAVPGMLELSYAQVGATVERWVEAYRRAGYGPATAWRCCWKTEPSTSCTSWPSTPSACPACRSTRTTAAMRLPTSPSTPSRNCCWPSPRGRRRSHRGSAESAHKPRILIVDQDTQPPPPRRPATAATVTPSTRGEPALHVGHDRAAQGLHALPRLRGFRRAPGTPDCPGSAGCAAARTASTTRCRCTTSTPAWSRCSGRSAAVAARSNPIVSTPSAGGPMWSQTRATVVHYLGIVVQALMRQPGG